MCKRYQITVTIVCLSILPRMCAFGTYEPVIASLVAEQGGTQVLQKRLEMVSAPGAEVQRHQEIVKKDDFSKLLLASRAYHRPVVICFLPRTGLLAPEQIFAMKRNFSQLAAEEKPGNFLYALVDVNKDGKTDVIYHRFLQQLKLDKRQSLAPLTVVLMGDRILFPTHSGYMSVEDFRNFIASKMMR